LRRCQPENAPKAFGDSAPPDLLAGFNSGDKVREGGRGKDRRGGQLREDRGKKEGTEGEEGRKRGTRRGGETRPHGYV